MTHVLGARPRLLVSDVDSTLIVEEVIDMIAAHAGREAEVSAITESAMRGEIDFAASLHQRVAALAGVPETVFEEVARDATFTPGTPELIDGLRAEGFEIGLVSGGFEEIVRFFAEELDIRHYRANRLEVRDGVLTGRVIEPVVDRAAKAAFLREFAAQIGADMHDTVAIGDGANDLDMLAAAGFGIAFNAKPAVQAQADAVITGPRIDEALPAILQWFNAS